MFLKMKFLLLLCLPIFTWGASPSVHAADAFPPGEARIARIWHGKVPNAKAVEYRNYISAALPKFKTIAGNQGYTLFTEKRGEETHFLVISYWDSKKSIEAYAGKDISKTHFLPRDKEFLKDPEDTVMNYDVEVVERK